MENRISLYYQTIKHLKPTQILHQIIERLPHIGIEHCDQLAMHPHKLNYIIPELDLDDQYLNRFDVDKLLNNEVDLLHETHRINLKNWKIENIESVSHLWRFNLHYFEYTIPLAVKYKETGNQNYYYKFREFIMTWIDCHQEMTSDAWQAYTVSLRIPNWLLCFECCGDTFENDQDFKDKVWQSLFKQYQHLKKHPEKHILGNHYFENIKTIILCSIVFDEEPVFQQYYKLLTEQIREQILPDGMHFERSAMYHKIILEDLIRLIYWIRQRDKAKATQFRSTLQKMTDCIYSLENGMGKTPFFNDASDGVAKTSVCLLKTVKNQFQIKPQEKLMFYESGYCKLYNGDKAVIFDAGKLGPDYQAGHSHCDTLSFEMSINEEPFIVNSGTYQYQSHLRSFFRSSQAHNTVLIDSDQQSECWGEHRVAKRIQNVAIDESGMDLVAGHFEDVHHNIHYRQLRFLHGGCVLICDRVFPQRRQLLSSYYHFAPGCVIEKHDKNFIIKDQNHCLICRIYPINQQDAEIHKRGDITNYSPEFGLLQIKEVLELTCRNDGQPFGCLMDFDNNDPAKMKSILERVKRRID